jgi:hypothetical protein
MSERVGWNPEEDGYLPELIREEFFDHPFYAAVAEAYWIDKKLTGLHEALIPACDKLDNQELIQLAKLIREEFPDMEELCGYHTASMWLEPDELSVNQDGKVFGRVGNVSAVNEYVRTMAEHGFEELETREHLTNKIIEAAERYRGDEFAFFIDQMLDKDQMRRLE